MKCFFPVENSRFGRPKTNFRCFQKWKAKKKKRKKILTHFYNFSSFHFQFSTFPSVILNFHPFSVASFFPIRQQKFPGQKSLGALCPTSCPPPLPVMPLRSTSCVVYSKQLNGHYWNRSVTKIESALPTNLLLKFIWLEIGLACAKVMM